MPACTSCSSQRVVLEAIAQPMALTLSGEKSLSLRAFAQSCRRRWTRHSPSDPAIVGSSHRAASSQPGRTNVNKDCATHSEERTYVRGDFFFFFIHLGRVGEGVVNFFSFMFTF